jgi:hypothetical protein
VDISPRNIPEEGKKKKDKAPSHSHEYIVNKSNFRGDELRAHAQLQLVEEEKEAIVFPRDTQKSSKLSGDSRIPDIVIAGLETCSILFRLSSSHCVAWDFRKIFVNLLA